MFSTLAFLVVVTNSIIILNLSLYNSRIIYKVSILDSYSITTISFTFLGLYKIIIVLNF